MNRLPYIQSYRSGHALPARGSYRDCKRRGPGWSPSRAASRVFHTSRPARRPQAHHQQDRPQAHVGSLEPERWDDASTPPHCLHHAYDHHEDEKPRLPGISSCGSRKSCGSRGPSRSTDGCHHRRRHRSPQPHLCRLHRARRSRRRSTATQETHLGHPVRYQRHLKRRRLSRFDRLFQLTGRRHHQRQLHRRPR